MLLEPRRRHWPPSSISFVDSKRDSEESLYYEGQDLDGLIAKIYNPTSGIALVKFSIVDGIRPIPSFNFQRDDLLTPLSHCALVSVICWSSAPCTARMNLTMSTFKRMNLDLVAGKYRWRYACVHSNPYIFHISCHSCLSEKDDLDR